MKGNMELSLTSKEKIIILVSVFITFILMFLPLYQKGVNHVWQERINASEQNMRQMEFEMRELEYSIAEARTPEALIRGVTENGLEYAEISTDSSVRIAKGE